MNIIEKLAAEIERVVGVRSTFEELRGYPNTIVEPQIFMMTHSIDKAKKAIGSGDPIRILKSLTEMDAWHG